MNKKHLSVLSKAMKEVVGVQINGTIYGGKSAIDAVRLIHKPEQIERIWTRPMVNFMAACDLGKNWENLAQCPTLCNLD